MAGHVEPASVGFWGGGGVAHRRGYSEKEASRATLKVVVRLSYCESRVLGVFSCGLGPFCTVWR